MKKVLFLINNLNRGGAERVFVNQANNLHRAGGLVYFGLLFSSPVDSFASELELPVEQIFSLAGLRSGNLGRFWTLQKIIRRHKIEVIYSTLELSNIFARLTKIFNPRLRVIIREGSAVIDKNGQTSPKPTKFRLLDIILNLLASRVIAVSDEIAIILRGYQPHIASKIVVVENGVMLGESRAEVEKRLKAKTSQNTFQILTAASMNYYERAFEYLIEAISLLPTELRNRTTLIFAGDGTLRPMYEKQTKELGLEKQIKFLGRLDTARLVEEYKRADVFVLCSTSEGSPNVIIEAASRGLPVVTTRVGSAVTMVVEGETGWFIPFKNSQAIADKLIWLATHESKRLAMGLTAYDHVAKQFSFVSKMEELKGLLFGSNPVK
ncbi:MAG: hypothetical protein A2571_01470 [Candidatus Vogelbacteria bacterium RIFOXYD1_FULL_44_32]|uniref:Glycosyl transferase family 1 domain-containing protein n=1 Tax=Candidatus Vogelbacteria bacterium RIFOXYD1_FULL_44_32 TaxID=1802438 RepID=A0A1G2QCY0_9BACT|nr:MAG: hypothetical protein A2571_01470 [Candidatus Vogelbacteria bacterium RIFOXYD1_FULL_44_32]